MTDYRERFRHPQTGERPLNPEEQNILNIARLTASELRRASPREGGAADARTYYRLTPEGEFICAVRWDLTTGGVNNRGNLCLESFGVSIKRGQNGTVTVEHSTSSAEKPGMEIPAIDPKTHKHRSIQEQIAIGIKEATKNVDLQYGNSSYKVL